MINLECSILLAEDDPFQRELLVRALVSSNSSVKVTTASNGEELFELLREKTYDCLVIDCNMPPLGVKELIGSAAVRRCGCPVIAMSSCEDQGVVIDSVRSGAVDFVPKYDALHASFLWDCVRKVVARKRRNDEERRQIARRQKQLESLAQTDPLTGLLNRRSFDRRLMENTKDGHNTGSSFACIMFDVDHFKSINDQYGHAAGDAVLSAVGRAIRSALGPEDAAFRWGGEEFLVLRACRQFGESYVWANELRRMLSALPIRVSTESGGKDVKITSSVGVEFVGCAGLEPTAIERADQAMYLAKGSGRNRVCTWPMVGIDRALHRVAGLPKGSPADRREEFIAECQKGLGMTQRKQITEHCEKVARLAIEIGEAMGVESPAEDQLSQAGLFHDLGKCILPGDLLEKAGPLSAAEKRVVDQASTEGAQMSLKLGVDSTAVEAIRQQRMLACGDEVPAAASILRVADAFVAMTTDHPYGPTRSIEEAQQEIERQRGRQFHPRAIDALAGMLSRRNAA
ncbi:MAG TPA: diguanylate cyclase [Tepidisphaeraceae bacterium]|jgi:diguanylate cyclase (GGDEF)-like protein/putative nucleotidyltransferase with HDIG domain|nr:diguanylate cyclase [Tepidisphaeraceae bacterium]